MLVIFAFSVFKLSKIIIFNFLKNIFSYSKSFKLFEESSGNFDSFEEKYSFN